MKAISCKTPKLRHHKATNQAYAVLNGKYLFFGLFGTPEATQRYHQTLAEWHSAGGLLPSKGNDLTINEIAARFWVHVNSFYRHPDGSPTSEKDSLRYAIRPLLKLYGNTKACKFGPIALRAVQNEMIQIGWCRNNINRSISRVKMLFKWAVSQELIPASIYQAICTVPGLQRGRSEAKETRAIKPVKPEYIDAVKPYVSRQVWAMIHLQLLTAARPGEIIAMRPCDIDRNGKIWTYSPADHKTAHHGYERKIYIGPRGQEVLKPFLLRPVDTYCFSPSEAYADKLNQRHAGRKAPISCGNRPGANLKENPQWQPGEQYTVDSYRRAIIRAIETAFESPDHLKRLPKETRLGWQKRLNKKQKAELRDWHKQHHWHPHQLRHNAATFLRKEFGLETARIILGHRSATITEVYAEMDQEKALDAIVRVG